MAEYIRTAQLLGSKGLSALGGWVQEDRAPPFLLSSDCNQEVAHIPRYPRLAKAFWRDGPFHQYGGAAGL